MKIKNLEKILIIDFGSQVTQLIGRQIRELGVYCELISYQKFNKGNFIKENVKGIVLSGGPKSTLSSKAPAVDKKISQPIYLFLEYVTVINLFQSFSEELLNINPKKNLEKQLLLRKKNL